MPGIPEYKDMLPLKTFLHMMPPVQLALMLELTNSRLAAKEKREMTRQESLRRIGIRDHAPPQGREERSKVAIRYSWLDGLLRNPWSGVQNPSGARVQ
jgi:hypothetical protein